MKKKYRHIFNRKRRLFYAITLVILPLCLYSCVDSLIFHPPASSYRPSAHLVRIPVENNEQIAAFYLPGTSNGYVVLFSHGNAEDIGNLGPHMQRYRQEGFGVLAYDYRGYGLSDGDAGEQNTYQDIEAAYRYLTNTRKIDPAKIIIHGRSVGSGPSVWLASNYPAGGVILESPFASINRVVTRWPLWPIDKYNNLSRIDQIGCPLLVIHGTEDNVVPFWHGQALFEKANQPKMYYWVNGAGHNNLIYFAGENYWQTINRFEDMVIEFHKENSGNNMR